MNDEDKPKKWVTIVKLVVWSILVVVLVGLGLYYSAEFKTYAPEAQPVDNSWGLAKDSPIRSKR